MWQRCNVIDTAKKRNDRNKDKRIATQQGDRLLSFKLGENTFCTTKAHKRAISI